jgi:hypothetical protein
MLFQCDPPCPGRVYQSVRKLQFKTRNLAQRVCDRTSCEGSGTEWNLDAITDEKMDPDECVVLKGKKCVKATTLKHYWERLPQNEKKKDPFTQAEVDPCGARRFWPF